MPVNVLGLLLVAALLHAGWNVLLKTADDPLRTAGRGMVVGAVSLIPTAFVGWLLIGRPAIPAEAWLLAVVSGVFEAAYFVLLSAAYRRGDLSLVYPIARGTAPVLAVAVGVFVLGERLGLLGAVGVACLLAGILVLQRPWAVLHRGSDQPRHVREASWLAVATGVTIACYSAVDRNGARLIEPWLYAALIWTATAVFLVGWIALVDRRAAQAARRGDALAGRTDRAAGIGPLIETVEAVAALTGTQVVDVPEAFGPSWVGWSSVIVGSGSVVGSGVVTGSSSAVDRRGRVWAAASSSWGRAVIGGLVTVGAYLLVLVAYRMAPLTAVAPVRESAIVLVTGWGTLRLGEAAGRRSAIVRVGASAVILIGGFLLALER